MNDTQLQKVKKILIEKWIDIEVENIDLILESLYKLSYH